MYFLISVRKHVGPECAEMIGTAGTKGCNIMETLNASYAPPSCTQEVLLMSHNKNENRNYRHENLSDSQGPGIQDLLPFTKSHTVEKK